MHDEKKLKPSSTNQSTQIAFAIIELLAQNGQPMRLLDISQRLGLNSSKVLRFLTALQAMGYVSQNKTTHLYRLTFKLCRIANQISSRDELYSLTHPYLVHLNEVFQEALCVSVERDMRMVYADVAVSVNQSLMSVQRIGNESPMHCTGNGKLLLLNYTPEQLDRFIQERGLERRTENTITTREALVAALEKIRAEGVAYDDEECEAGVRCIACPIRDYTGAIVAGISATGPSSRMNAEKMDAIKPILVQAAKEISLELGYTE